MPERTLAPFYCSGGTRTSHHTGIMFAFLAAAVDVTDQTSIWEQVDQKRLQATVEKLASFNTRNTNTPELGQACDWVASQFQEIPGLQVETIRYTLPSSRRVPVTKEVPEVVATLPGKTDRTLLVGGHVDTINMQADIATGRAPGANDDASGVALTLELARLMAKHQWNQTIKFVAFSGEEQGLVGSTALAKIAHAQKWNLEAVLSNDMVGNSSNKAGQKDSKHVRVFSEEGATHESRELARVVEWLVRHNIKGFGVKLVFRRDRFGRGGDHTPFVEQGFSAVRFVEVHEEYSRQHTPDDLPQYVDFSYLANNVRANAVALASLAQAGPAPTDVRIVRDQSQDTTIHWKSTPGTRYALYWRETTSPVWESYREVGETNEAKVTLVNKDDHVFAVGAVGGIPQEAK